MERQNTEWFSNSGCQPVSDGTYVHVVFVSGRNAFGFAESFSWSTNGKTTDIRWYRVGKENG